MAAVAPLDLLERRLASLGQQRPDLMDAIELQGALLRERLSEVRAPYIQAFPLPRERVSGKVRAGSPLLHGEPAQVDMHYAADLFSRLVNNVADRKAGEGGAQVEALVSAATGGGLDPQRLFAEAFVQHHDHLAEMALLAGVDAELLLTLASLSVAPLLQAYAARLAPLLELTDNGAADGAVWQEGYCPICGGWPLLGELRGVELQQWLRCAACGIGWRSRRLACPYCANDDFRTLGLLTVEGENRFRIATCDRCHGYLKVGNAFDPPPAELLALDDLASVHLDLAAMERGYQRPGGTGFRLELAVPESSSELLDLDD